MNRLTTLLFTLAAGATLSLPAIAESFNDRGPDYSRSTTVSSHASSEPAIAMPQSAGAESFNDRGPDYRSTTVSSHASSEPVIAMPQSYANRGDESSVTPTQAEKSQLSQLMSFHRAGFVRGSQYPL